MRSSASILIVAGIGASACTAFLAPPSSFCARDLRPRRATCRSRVATMPRVSVEKNIGEHAAAPGTQAYQLEPRPEAFNEVLTMLQELDRNGSWPTTSRRRAELLKNTTRRDSAGDSFTIGLFPPPLRMPHSNSQLPGLLEALLKLEKAICPARPCSTTITVNRHAEFRPHRDSGAGAGQSTSLIVGLGDYIGGSLMVEGKAHDIRYKGLEFDGWRELHWTRPFRGERYSLVWYTPQGLEEPRVALERGDGWDAATKLAESLPPVKIVTKSLANLEAAREMRTPIPGQLTRQKFSMVPPNVNFKSRISMLAIERLDRVQAFNVQVPLRSTAKGMHEGFQGRVLFDSEASVPDFRRLQLCESVRVVLLHEDYEFDLGPSPAISAISAWLVAKANWDLGLKSFESFGNVAPASPDFPGFHVRCKTSAGRLYPGASQEIRTALALAVHERFGWKPKIKRSEAAIEILVAFHKSGVMVEMPLLVQNGIRWEEHAGSDAQLGHFENAVAERLPRVVPKWPARLAPHAGV